MRQARAGYEEAERIPGRASITFCLDPTPPFRLDFTVWALRRWPDNLVDRWDGRTYRRVLVTAGRAVEAAVSQPGPPEDPQLRVTLMGGRVGPELVPAATRALERRLGLHLELTPFYELAGSDPLLGPLAERFRGLKPPRFATLFECLANAIACQQLTLALGIRLLNRLSEAYGLVASGHGAGAVGFPPPEALARAGLGSLRGLGFSGQKARALTELAGAGSG